MFKFCKYDSRELYTIDTLLDQISKTTISIINDSESQKLIVTV